MPKNQTPNQILVLHEDAHFLVLDKPSGISTTSPDGKNCLTEWAKNHLLKKSKSKVCHPSSRLDKEVSGIVTFAKTKKAIEHLLQARKNKDYKRVYCGIVLERPEKDQGEWNVAIGMDPSDPRKRVAAVKCAIWRGVSKESVSRYSVFSMAPHGYLLNLEPQTGRTHQLRVHCEFGGVSLFGDKHYNGQKRFVLPNGIVASANRVMLHCKQVSFPQISGTKKAVFESPIPTDFLNVWLSLGGAKHDLQT